MFDTVFDFNGTQDFFAESDELVVEGGYFGGDTGTSGLFASGYEWDFGVEKTFRVVAWTNKQSDTLQGLEFYWETTDPSTFVVRISPQDILKGLDMPSQMLIAVRPGGRVSNEADLLIVYDQGIVFDVHGWLPITHRSETEVIVELCLGNEVFDGGLILGSLYLLEPFANGLNDLSPLQEIATIREIERHHMRPIEEVFGITPTDIAQLAESSSNACIYADIHPD